MNSPKPMEVHHFDQTYEHWDYSTEPNGYQTQDFEQQTPDYEQHYEQDHYGLRTALITYGIERTPTSYIH